MELTRNLAIVWQQRISAYSWTPKSNAQSYSRLKTRDQ